MKFIIIHMRPGFQCTFKSCTRSVYSPHAPINCRFKSKAPWSVEGDAIVFSRYWVPQTQLYASNGESSSRVSRFFELFWLTRPLTLPTNCFFLRNMLIIFYGQRNKICMSRDCSGMSEYSSVNNVIVFQIEICSSLWSSKFFTIKSELNTVHAQA